MARLYESSTDYEENVTYAGDTLASDRYDSEADYDRITVTYEGAVTDTPQGYASTATTYNAVTSSYNGSKTVDRTATGAGTGASATVQLTIHPRTSSSSGAGASTSTGLRIVPRTATGAGAGTSNNAILHEHLRTPTEPVVQQPATPPSAYTSTLEPAADQAQAQASPRHAAYTGAPGQAPAQEPKPVQDAATRCSVRPPTTRSISPAPISTGST